MVQITRFVLGQLKDNHGAALESIAYILASWYSVINILDNIIVL